MIAIDYSMTCPAACNITAGQVEFWFHYTSKRAFTLPHVTSHTSSISETGIERSTHQAELLYKWIKPRLEIPTVYIEDYSFGSHGKVFHIGEHTGVLKYMLWTHGVNIVPVPPTVIKKFATGKGNALKHAMCLAFIKDYPDAKAWLPKLFARWKDTQSPGKTPFADLADAYWIAKYGLSREGIL